MLVALAGVAAGATQDSAARPSRVPRARGPAVLSQEVGGVSVMLEPGRTGFLTVVVHGPVGASVAVSELGTATAPRVAIATVTLGQATVRLRNAVAWRCADLAPTVEATEVSTYGGLPPARASTATPSCAHRLAVTLVPTRLHVGYPVTIEVSDQWRQGGLRVRACIGGDLRRCAGQSLRADRPTFFRLRPRVAGTAEITVSDDYQQIAQHLPVRGGRPLLLAAGDSEMQVLDDYLASDLARAGGARVLADARQSTAISSPFVLDWPAHAARLVAARHPDVVAMFLGGNEGFPIAGTPCCGVAWSRLYARLVGRMMAVYRQHGGAVVYWFLIPTPSRPSFVSVVTAVNRGIIMAARRFPRDVHAFDLRPTFSPGGRYLDRVDYQGRSITVHESDGFHLSTSADVIVAHLFVARARRDGVLP